MLRPVPSTTQAAATRNQAERSPERQSPLILGNKHATNTDVLQDYLADLQSHGSRPIVVETQPTTTDTVLALVDGVTAYMELHDGARPTAITAIGGDRTFADLIATLHDARLAASLLPLTYLSPAWEALALAVAAPVPGGNGNDGARFSYGRLMRKKPPMPWEWNSLRMRFPMLLSIMRPDAEPERHVVANYFGLGASAELINYIDQNRAEWRTLTHGQRTRRELGLSLDYLATTQIEIARKGLGCLSLASLDITCTDPMAKRIRTRTAAHHQTIQEIQTPLQGKLGIIRMAGLLAVGKRADGRLVNSGEFTIGQGGAELYIDGDAMPHANQGTVFTYTRSGIAVPVRSQI